MKARRLDADDSRLFDPRSPEWDGLSAEEFVLSPTPLTAQPSVYIQAKWKDVAYGEEKRLSVRVAHNSGGLYFHLSWADETADDGIRDTDQFADAAAVLFPVNGDAPLMSMGSPQQPVNAWYWRPDLEAPFSVYAQGTGTTRRDADSSLRATGERMGDRWSVVLNRSFGAGDDARAGLQPGTVTKVAFAVWQGSNQERGGLKAATLEWEPLEIEQ